jgi:DNA invertase Pin-like site-specific DNA recombinase
MSRWGRNTSDLLDSLKELAAKKVSVIALSGKLDFDMTAPSGKLMVTLLAGLAEFERDLLAERVNSGLAHARSIGKVLGRPSKATLTEICERISSGQSIRSIAKDLGVSKTTVLKHAKSLKASA